MKPSRRGKNPTVGRSIHPLERPVVAFHVENEVYPKTKEPVVDLVVEDLSENEEDGQDEVPNPVDKDGELNLDEIFTLLDRMLSDR